MKMDRSARLFTKQANLRDAAWFALEDMMPYHYLQNAYIITRWGIMDSHPGEWLRGPGLQRAHRGETGFARASAGEITKGSTR